MVRSIHKISSLFLVVVAVTIMGILINPLSQAFASQSENVTFNVNLTEILTVSVTKPTTWASGDMEALLRNKISVSAKTNNYYGATLSMYADGLTLNNTVSYDSTKPATFINTLDANTYTNGTFPVNAWGYSVEDTDAGSSSASYLPIVTEANAVTLIERTTGTTGTNYSKDVFFGAKANTSKQAGTYAQTVNFVAVTGLVDTENPKVPTNPSTDNPANEIATYNTTTGRTTYSSRSTNTTTNTTTTATQVTSGNTVSTYANPAGVTTSKNGITALAVGLAVAASVAAVSGTVFFILAKRHDDDDDEEEQE